MLALHYLQNFKPEYMIFKLRTLRSPFVPLKELGVLTKAVSSLYLTNFKL